MEAKLKRYILQTLLEERLWKVGESNTFTFPLTDWEFEIGRMERDNWERQWYVNARELTSNRTWCAKYHSMSAAFLSIVNSQHRYKYEHIYDWIMDSGLAFTIKEDCKLWESLNPTDYMYLNVCKDSERTKMYQLILNGRELWYGTLQEINAIVKSMIIRVQQNDFKEE